MKPLYDDPIWIKKRQLKEEQQQPSEKGWYAVIVDDSVRNVLRVVGGPFKEENQAWNYHNNNVDEYGNDMVLYWLQDKWLKRF